jgi:hypothetical protein
MVDIIFVTVIKSDLVFVAVVFQLPIGRRSDYQMNGFVGKFIHTAAVAIDYDMFRVHFLRF